MDVRRYRCLIVDDEELGRDNVRLALASEPDVDVVGECRTGAEAVACIRSLDPDVVFLDIQMPRGGGFDVITEIGPERMPAVVFVTAHDVHAIRAFDVHALDYVLKPFDDDRLRRALARVRDRLTADASRDVADRLGAVIRQLGEAPRPVRATRLAIRDEERVYFVDVDAIDWIESDGNYVKIHAGPSEHRMRATLQEVLGQLDGAVFRRIHRRIVVNVGRVREVQAWFGGDHIAVLTDGQKLRVSRTYARDFLAPFQ